ncbi:hypothetical protein [Chlorogloea sp. CCALA 695]|uniref:hypothetical protein n=1 Tax=Chlorogloea sp. CCALA 695 TaxID=2107693 RepID=UPI000D080F5D|nr:hypothetical protein [Chlorogloea sp. CCALA 695]PSB31376.1 hypothetical protein C7B70_13680 [Chlorogloea sp. CCALA 695]
MDFERRTLKKRHPHKITLEFAVISDEVDLVKCQQIANNLAASIPVQLLADRHIEVTCSLASVQPSPKRTYDQVQLPPLEMTVSVLARKK